MLDLVNNNMMRGGPGEVMKSMASSTVQDADDEASDSEGGQLTKRFRRRPRSPSRKDADELKYRVSLISNNEYVVSMPCRNRSASTRTK